MSMAVFNPCHFMLAIHLYNGNEKKKMTKVYSEWYPTIVVRHQIVA